MCMGCFEEYRSDVEKIPVTQDILDAVEAVNVVYQHSLTGGGMHIVTDDWNLDDDDVDFCLRTIPTDSHYGDTDSQTADLHCAQIFRALTVPQRALVLAIVEGGIDVSARL